MYREIKEDMHAFDESKAILLEELVSVDGVEVKQIEMESENGYKKRMTLKQIESAIASCEVIEVKEEEKRQIRKAELAEAAANLPAQPVEEELQPIEPAEPVEPKKVTRILFWQDALLAAKRLKI